MAPKRKNDEVVPSGELAPRNKKKQKVAAARTINVQSVPQQSAAGPSTFIRENSMQGLPPALDVERFAEARSFEIRAMQDSIKNAQTGSSQRSWQQLPRHLRRRAASHDVRRVPIRLRDKARAEMDPVKKKPSSRSGPRRGPANSTSRTKSLLKRQQNKTWLETHIWHAKRMHMEDLWGYRLAIQPTEKSFRPSHRASIHGAIIHDASYYSLLELRGPQKILKRLLEFCCEPQGNPGSARYSSGARVCDTHIYKAESYPFDLIAPVTIMWRPVQDDPVSQPGPSSTDAPLQDEGPDLGNKRRRKSKGKAKNPVSNLVVDNLEVQRTAWVRTHPSVWDDVSEALRLSASFALESFKKSADCNGNDYKVELIDLRQQVNIFEIMGPKSSQVIRGALSPVPEDKRKEFKEFWSALKNLQSPGELPSGMIIGLTVEDPRLNFPPKNATVKTPDSHQCFTSQVHCFPTSVLARSDIWDQDVLAAIKTPRYKKKDLDERRSKNVIPGTNLPPQRQDDRVPILLIQRSLKDASQSLHGWTVIIPSGWSMAFFSSLIYTGTRVGGQRERQTQSFEAGLANFPRDYPTTDQYDQYSSNREKVESELWERKPPAKRLNYEKTGTRSPWKADWKVVLGIQSTEDPQLVTSQREAAGQGAARPWLLRGAVLHSVLKNIGDMLIPAAGLLSEINAMRTSTHNDPLRPFIRAEDLWKSALVMVRLEISGRGSPEDLAMIYQLRDDELYKWRKVKRTGRAGLAVHVPPNDVDEDEDESELAQCTLSADAIIGYVTTGGYSLSIGKSHAIGAMPLAKLLEIQKQAARTNETTPVVKIRNRDSVVCRVARIELLEK